MISRHSCKVINLLYCLRSHQSVYFEFLLNFLDEVLLIFFIVLGLQVSYFLLILLIKNQNLLPLLDKDHHLHFTSRFQNFNSNNLNLQICFFIVFQVYLFSIFLSFMVLFLFKNPHRPYSKPISKSFFLKNLGPKFDFNISSCLTTNYLLTLFYEIMIQYHILIISSDYLHHRNQQLGFFCEDFFLT